MSRTRATLTITFVLCLGLIALLIVSNQIRVRAQLVERKVFGSLPDMTWVELSRIVARRRSYLDYDVLASSGNVFAAIRNPYRSQTDIDAGEEIFQSRCVACHAHDGTASESKGPDLSLGNFKHGSSDWALYRNITHGVANTAMAPIALGEKEAWQVVAFVDSSLRRRDTAPSDVPSIAAPSVSYDRLVHANREPRNWLTYSGALDGQRHSTLAQVDASNADRLRVEWTYQSPTNEARFLTTPLVVDGVMYLTEPPNDVVALAADTGELLWRYHRRVPEFLMLCCQRINRGLAILGTKLFLGALDGHLVALDARTGKVVWETEVADYKQAYNITSAPLALDGKIVTGAGGGDYPTRGFVAAYDADTGKELWRFQTIPGRGQPGNETWPSDAWQKGGGAAWLTGSFDPELNLIYWGVGNPVPDFNGDLREGDNLYTDSVVALDADTGELKWFFQFTPHDEHDWDACQIPILVDQQFHGRPRKLLLWANRNGFYYVLDRLTGEYLTARAFTDQSWADGIDSHGRPISKPSAAPSRAGSLVRPGPAGATNWWSPTYSPLTRLVYVPVVGSWGVVTKGEPRPRAGEQFLGGTNEGGFDWAAVRALDYATGDLEWEFKPAGPRLDDEAQGGLLSTAGNVLFGGLGSRFYVLDARNGKLLHEFNLGGHISAAPITYEASGRQQVTVAAGRALFTFALEEPRP